MRQLPVHGLGQEFSSLLAAAPLGLSVEFAQENLTEGRNKLLAIDVDLRMTFGNVAPKTLPEATWNRQRKLPDASARSFDWINVLGLTPIYHQGDKGNCTAMAAIAALEWNWQVRNGTNAKPNLSPQPVFDRLQKAE